MDYDKTDIPAAYDRARSRSPEVLALWMDAIAARFTKSSSATILDLGCGTGRFAGPLRARFGGRVVGVDPSSKMLRQARGKPEASGIRYLVAQGEAIPLRVSSVDLVFMSMVFHHFADPRRMAAECHRVLRPGGQVFLRGGTAERIQAYPMTPWFPASVPIMERAMDRAAAIEATFESAGFSVEIHDVLEQEIAPSHRAFADQLEAGGDSVLVQLAKADLEAGLRALRSRAAEIDPQPVREPIDFFWFAKAS